MMYPCTCADRRNDIECPAHVENNHMAQAFIRRNPLYVQIAWELDLHWASDRVDRLFYQHNHVEGWNFPARC
ncbi:hypothetical protein PBI_BERNARDO_90 [Mycobacterium phage Bernardo]|uniref:Uncharacterized protein n=1 Tax=Mycobacterium phage Bernardo TaxID=1429903 RepID=V5R9L5_9CAUD|nr:hypothetical protein X818_gp090 [Mycobacterium phage Bernardo]AHB31767.1 hypothetical protein PBI_BERNARDO_90 [Mycobacterium phage Bernardo]